jgi:hypothetical protein
MKPPERQECSGRKNRLALRETERARRTAGHAGSDGAMSAEERRKE